MRFGRVLSWMKYFANQCISKFLHVIGFIDESFLTTEFKSFSGAKILRYENWRQQAVMHTIIMNSDASLKLDDELNRVGVGVGIVARNQGSMPIGWQLHWFNITGPLVSDHILSSEAFAMYNNVNLAEQMGHQMVSFQTDSLSVKKILDYRYQKMIPTDVNMYLDKARNIINARRWSYDFVHRQSNTPADFLANYARGLNAMGGLDEATPLFRNDVLPMGMKEMFINDLGMFHVIVKPLPQSLPTGGGSTGAITGVKLLTATNTIDSNSATIQYWANVVTEHMDKRNLKCYFVEVWDGNMLLLQFEMPVRTLKANCVSSCADSEEKLVELLHDFELLNPPTPWLPKCKGLTARLTLQFYDPSKVDSKLILRPKDKIGLPADYMHLGPLDYKYAAFSPKILARKVNHYPSLERLLESYTKAIENIREENFLEESEQATLVWQVEGELYQQI